MTKREKYLERVLILRTLVNYGPMFASDLADRANTECDIDALDGLPEITRRGIGMKLDSLNRLGLVAWTCPEGPDRPRLWTITGKGEEMAMSMGIGSGPTDPVARLRLVAATMASTMRDVLSVVEANPRYPWEGGALKQQMREDITAYELLGLDVEEPTRA